MRLVMRAADGDGGTFSSIPASFEITLKLQKLSYFSRVVYKDGIRKYLQNLQYILAAWLSVHDRTDRSAREGPSDLRTRGHPERRLPRQDGRRSGEFISYNYQGFPEFRY